MGLGLNGDVQQPTLELGTGRMPQPKTRRTGKEEQKMIQDKLNDGLIFRELKEDGS